MPANETQMENIDIAIEKLTQVIQDLRGVNRIIKKFRDEVDPDDQFNTADYTSVRTLFAPLWTGARDVLDTDWSDAKSYINGTL